VEWIHFQNHYGLNATRRMPLPRSLANLKREFSEAKWNDAKERSYSRINRKKHRPSKKQLPDPAVARSKKRLASRFYRLKTRHALTGEYLHQGTKSRPSAQRWWCERRNTKQIREHLFKKCPAWKKQQKSLWTVPPGEEEEEAGSEASEWGRERREREEQLARMGMNGWEGRWKSRMGSNAACLLIFPFYCLSFVKDFSAGRS